MTTLQTLIIPARTSLPAAEAHVYTVAARVALRSGGSMTVALLEAEDAVRRLARRVERETGDDAK